MKKVLIIAGPTASGKSSLALDLAQRLNGVIINGDSIENPVDGLVQETVEFTGTGPLYLRL